MFAFAICLVLAEIFLTIWRVYTENNSINSYIYHESNTPQNDFLEVLNYLTSCPPTPTSEVDSHEAVVMPPEVTREVVNEVHKDDDEEEKDDDCPSMDEIWKEITKSSNASRKLNTKYIMGHQLSEEEKLKKLELAVAAPQKMEGWRRREVLVVPSGDELFDRVERLIKKHHEQLHLQRLESQKRGHMLNHNTAFQRLEVT